MNRLIGYNAGTIYEILSQRGRLSMRKIGELTHQKESNLYLSMGWLLREDKISISENKGEWFLELNHC